MSDRHLRILRLVANARQRALDDHDAADHTEQSVAVVRRRHLKRVATRTKARVTEAQARRLSR